MNTVIQLPASDTMTPDLALDSARALEPADVLIVGYTADGEFFFRSSRMSCADGLFLAEQMRRRALGD